METLTSNIYADVEKVLNQAKLDYADVRIQDLQTTSLVQENNKLEKISVGNELGLGVRVIVNGKPGFYSSNDFNLPLAFKKAVKLAKLNPKKEKVRLKDVKPIRKEVKEKSNIKDHSIENKIKLITTFEKYARISPKIKSIQVVHGDVTGTAYFFNNEGAQIISPINRARTDTIITSKQGKEIERTSCRVGGFNFNVYNDAEKMIKEKAKLAVDLLKAQKPKGGNFKAVLDPDAAGVYAHEAVGHASEADAIISNESILKGKIGKKIGSSAVNLVDDGTLREWGYVRYDDEGVPGKKTNIIKKGILKSYLHSRETAAKLGGAVTGNARAQAYHSLPQVRMSNTIFENGNHSFEEMVENIKDGYYLVGFMGGEVGPLEGTFSFASERAYPVKNGKIGKLHKGCTFSGKILDSLKEITAAQKKEKDLFSIGTCGKGGQWVPVSDGKCHIAINKILIGGK